MNETAEPGQSGSALKRLLLKNTLYVSLSQALAVPLSILVNAMMARYLAAEAFGDIYVASVFTAVAFLFVNFGHEGALSAAVARDPRSAGLLLGSSLLSRAGFVFVAYAVTAAACHLLGYPPIVQVSIAIMFLGSIFLSVVSAYKETIRGLERAEFPALAHFGQTLLVVVATVSALLLGAGVTGTLLAQAIAPAFLIPLVLWGLRSAGVHRLSFQWSTGKMLLGAGIPFVAMNIIGTLQPTIDALYLSKISSSETVGAYSVARRLIGVLMLPASGLIGALYPTLCRLWVEDRDAFQRASAGALRGVSLLAVPLAIGCGFYPEIGVSIFGREEFAAAEQDLRLLAVFVLLVYVSMPLGITIMAAGKQRIWSVVQGLCVVVSLVLDPFFVRWFEDRTKNGGLGVCATTTLSEILVVIFGFVLVPKGTVERRLVRTVLLSLVAGGAMVGLTYLLKPLVPALVAGTLAGIAYFVVLWLTGGIEQTYVEAIRNIVGRKLARFRGR